MIPDRPSPPGDGPARPNRLPPPRRYLAENLDRIAVIGAGRLGSALAPVLRAGAYVDGPLGCVSRGRTVVLLCVPDAEIPRAAAALAPGPLVGHCPPPGSPRWASTRASACTR